MFKYYFEQVNNVEVWPIISLIIFITFFIGLLVWVVKVDKKYIQDMSNLPVEEDAENNKNQFDYV
ncbi:MAG: cytochrome C oxidase Cbb3 [Cyclobacteriaceae bacterium]|nr:cytochrome C oxidase Cbb3 [Cyclobacteriaceae bacterium]